MTLSIDAGDFSGNFIAYYCVQSCLPFSAVEPNPVNTTTHARSLSTGVYDRLKEMIAKRELRPGTQLVQQTLARSLGTSPMPVIEALRRLERDGLVTHIPRLGSFVR